MLNDKGHEINLCDEVKISGLIGHFIITEIETVPELGKHVVKITTQEIQS